MNRKNNILTKDQIQVHIENLVRHRMRNDAIMAEHKRLCENRQDFQSFLIRELASQIRGYDTADEMLQEGVWDSLKKFVMTNPFKSRSDDGEATGKLKAALEKASGSLMATQFQTLEQTLPEWPNSKSSEDFMKGVALLGGVYESIKAGAIKGEIDIVIANEMIDAFRGYVENAEKGLKYKSRYFNEADDEAGAPEAEVIEEDAFGVSLKFLDKFFDAATTAAQGGKAVPKRMLRRIGNMNNRLEKEIANKGIDNLGPRERRAWEEMQQFRDQMDKANLDHHKDVMDVIDGGGGGGGGGGSELTQADFGIRGDGDSMDIARGFEQGQQSMTGKMGPDAGTMGKWAQDVSKARRVGDIEGVSSIPALYRSAGSMSTLMGWLGPGTYTALAGIGLPILAGGALAGILAKRWVGDSREGTLKKALKAIENITPDMVQVSPQDAAQQDQTAMTTTDAQAAEQSAEQSGKGPGGAEGGEKTVNVFKGKGGAGMQSTFAKAGIAGKDMSALLKGLRADLSGAGFTVLQEKSRERISLSNTLAAVQQIADAEQQEAAKAAIVALLRQHGISGDKEFQMAMRPGAAAGAEGGAAGGGSAAEQWVAAGKPELTSVTSNNLASRDADHITKGPNGEEIFKPEALEFAKAQVAWLEKNGQQAPSLLTTRITATETAGAAPSEPPEQAADAPVKGEPPQGETPQQAIARDKAQKAAKAAKQPAAPAGAAAAPEDDTAASAAYGQKKRAAMRGRHREHKENVQDEVICEDATYARWQKIAGIIQG